MFLNPIYDTPVRDVFLSQHPYAAEKIGEPYVCSYKRNDPSSLGACIDKALQTELKPMVPTDFTKEAYLQRVAGIFELKS
jgi:hypothetical protein